MDQNFNKLWWIQKLALVACYAFAGIMAVACFYRLTGFVIWLGGTGVAMSFGFILGIAIAGHVMKLREPIKCPSGYAVEWLKDGKWERAVSRQDNEVKAREFAKWLFKDSNAKPPTRIIEISYSELVLVSDVEKKQSQ